MSKENINNPKQLNTINFLFGNSTGLKKTGFFDFLDSLNSADLVTIYYLLITGIYIIFSASRLENVGYQLLIHGGIVLLILTITYWYHHYPEIKAIEIIKAFYPIALLAFLYGETDYMNNVIFDNLDPYFIRLDQIFFGCQPSMEFSKLIPNKWFNELLNFGYFSYYLLNFGVCIVIWLVTKKDFGRTIFIVCCSFYIYYVIFILFPVVGPQFYFQPPDSQIGDAYFFRSALKLVQKLGERPTGAFPSSHVGLGIILMILSFQYYKRLFWSILPLVILLCFATIYIKAHYLIDVIAGFISAPLIYLLSSQFHKWFTNFFQVK